MSEKASVRYIPLKRTIVLCGDIKAISATLLEGVISRLPKNAHKRPLYLIISSGGGDFYAMLKIRGFLSYYEKCLVTVAWGRAYSGALTIFQLGAHRLMTRESVLRFHRANHNFLEKETLNAADMAPIVEELRGIDAIQKHIYIERTAPLKTPRLKKLFTFFNQEAYLRYPQAKNFRLVDGVIPEPESLDALIDYLLSHETDPFLAALEKLSRVY